MGERRWNASADPFLRRRQSSRSLARSPSPSDHPLEPSLFDNTSLAITTHDFFKPLVSLLACIVITAVAAISISTVLLASFGATLYDDCGRRVEDVQRGIGEGRRRFRGSIEGVKTGVEKVVGGARGALELAVWAAGAKRPEVRAAPVMVMSDLEDSEEEGFGSMPGPSTSARAQKPRPRSRTRRRRSNAGAATNGRRPTPGWNPSPPPFDPTTNADTASHANTWTDDEDAPPYDVPHTTPWGTRPSSPSGRRASSQTSSTRDSLPPRPPLRILVPSIIFALLYTFIKVAWAFWRQEKVVGRGVFEGRGRARSARRE